MFLKKITVLFLFYVAVDAGGNEFRFDYTFHHQIDGWLKLHLVPATWSDARMLCRAEGAVLASPLTNHLHNAILELGSEVSASNAIFTGVHTTYAKGVYTSIEGMPLSRMPINWIPGSPNNFADGKSCLVMMISSYNNGSFADVSCTDVFPFICYKKKTKPEQITACGTVDTDYELNAVTGQCYKYHRRGLIFSSAYRTCIAEGGYLAVINSDEEFEVLKGLFGKNPEQSVFSPHTFFTSIGFSDPNDGGSWITIHGQTLKEAGFDHWENGEPNNSSQPLGELCGAMGRNNGKLYDAACNWPLAFICEMNPGSLELN